MKTKQIKLTLKCGHVAEMKVLASAQDWQIGTMKADAETRMCHECFIKEGEDSDEANTVER